MNRLAVGLRRLVAGDDLASLILLCVAAILAVVTIAALVIQ